MNIEAGLSDWVIPTLLIAWGVVLILTVPPALKRKGLTKTNFRGDLIPTASGIGILLWCVPALVYWYSRSPSKVAPIAFLIVAVGYGLLGFIDDRWGSRRYSGIKGHLNALLNDRTLTTGLVKAVGGLALGFIAGFVIAGRNPLTVSGAALLIALTANAINLVDLRPGRAGALFLLVAFAVISLSPILPAKGIALLILPASFAYVSDARGRMMLGDTGSNLLGGTLGLAIALAAGSGWILWLALSLLIALHVIAERWSISEIIERNPILRRIDAWTGVR